MQKLGIIEEWEYMDQEAQIVFPATKSGQIKMKVNSPERVKLYFHPLKGGKIDTKTDPVFLTTFNGLDEIQFNISQAIAIVGDRPYQLLTSNGQTVSVEPSAESFTRIVERKTVSADVAAIMQKSNINQIAMINAMSTLRGELDAVRSEGKRNAKLRRNDSSKGSDGDVEPPAKPEPDPNEKPPAEGEGAEKTVVGDQKNE